VRRNGYLWTCSKISDAVIWFPAPYFFTECKVSAIWRRFPSIFPFYMLNIRHISTSGLFDLQTLTHTHRSLGDNSNHVWSWHDHLLTSILSGDTLRDLVTLTFDLLILNSCHTWLVTCPTLPPSLKTICLFVLELSVKTSFIGYHWHCVFGYCACAVSRELCLAGKFYPAYLESTTPICLFTMQRWWLYDEGE